MTDRRSNLVLFDIDGTLMKGAGAHHKQALVDGILRITGRSTTLEGVDTAGKLDRDLIADMLRASGAGEHEIRRELAAAMLACEESYLASCAADLSPFLCRGVRHTLDELVTRGVVLGLVTGNLQEIGWRKIELAGIRQHFSIGAFAADGHTRAQVARVAAQRAQDAGLISGETRITLIGDHANDVAAARANGFHSVAVATGVLSFAELSQTNADLVVHHLEELDLDRLLNGSPSPAE